MRCPDCNKFVSYDEPECEVQSVETDGTEVRATVTVGLNCSECGNRLKEAEIEATADIEHECKPLSERDPSLAPSEPFVEGDEEFSVDCEGDAEPSDRLEDKDRHGKRIKNYRYMKHYYGFTLEQEVKCNKCGETFSVTIDGEEQASSFDEVC
jgi:phage FluMu protein Com